MKKLHISSSYAQGLPKVAKPGKVYKYERILKSSKEPIQRTYSKVFLQLVMMQDYGEMYKT